MISRLILLNATIAVAIGVAHWFGLITPAFEADSTYLLEVICAVYAVGLAWNIRVLLQVEVQTEDVGIIADTFNRSKSICGAIEARKLLMTSWLMPVRYIANALVLLGLIGTVIGFVIALSGVDPAQAGDVEAVGPMVATLIHGMSTALYTTLFGAVLNVCLMLNYNVVLNGARRMLAKAIALAD